MLVSYKQAACSTVSAPYNLQNASMKISSEGCEFIDLFLQFDYQLYNVHLF